MQACPRGFSLSRKRPAVSAHDGIDLIRDSEVPEIFREPFQVGVAVAPCHVERTLLSDIDEQRREVVVRFAERHGKELFFQQAADWTLMVVTHATEDDSFRVEKPQPVGRNPRRSTTPVARLTAVTA